MRGYELIRRPQAPDRLTLETLALAAGCHPQLVEKFVSYGLLQPAETDEARVLFDARSVDRLRRIQRLRGDLGINLPGIAAVCDLLERIEALRRELAMLRGRYANDR